MGIKNARKESSLRCSTYAERCPILLTAQISGDYCEYKKKALIIVNAFNLGVEPIT